MSVSDAIVGARWWKLDVHTHTPASDDTYWVKQNAPCTPREWLQRYMDAGVDLVAVTDHNTGAWVDKLKDAYAEMATERGPGFRELVLFPGVEISVNGGFHLLALFDPSTGSQDVSALLGSVEYRGTWGGADGTTTKSPIEVVRLVHAAGGLAIPAHADDAKGLLRVVNGSASTTLDANTLRQVLRSKDLVACEFISKAPTLPQICLDAGRSWTSLIGSDSHGFPGKNEPGSRFTWVKMAGAGLEGLRLALLDGNDFSVIRSDSDDPRTADPNARPEHYIEEVVISDAKYFGRGRAARLGFSPWMTSLIGGRGTGKSTVVHALRLAYGRDGELLDGLSESDAAKVFHAFRRVAKTGTDTGGLTTDTELRVTVSRDRIRHQLRWRMSGTGPAVYDEAVADPSGWALSSNPSVHPDRFPIRIFSQGQIADLAKGSGAGKNALLTLVDDTAAGARAAKDALTDAQQEFLGLRARARELDAKIARREPVQVELADVKRKLEAFEAGDGAAVLKRYQLATRQSREVERQTTAASALGRSIEVLLETLVLDDPPEGLFERDGDATRAAVEGLAAMHAAVDKAASAIRDAGRVMTRELDNARKSIDASVWTREVESARQAYEQLVEALADDVGTDPSQFGALVQRRQVLEKELGLFDGLGKERAALEVRLSEQLRVVRDARRSLSEVRRMFVEETIRDNDYVQMRLVPYGNEHGAIERTLRAAIGADGEKFASDILSRDEHEQPSSGLVFELLDGLPEDHAQRAEEVERRLGEWRVRFEAAAAGGGVLGGRLKNHLQREIGKQPGLLDSLMLYAPEDALEVSYSQHGDGKNWRPIAHASAGQQAAAMLAFLLAHGQEPIVLDQPEDDLDNHLIYDLVVRQLRHNKLRRQVIVVTHNANIVVNGDAEMIHALDFRSGQCVVVQNGSLQDAAVRAEVCRVMEGGTEAFKQRYQRLGARSE